MGKKTIAALACAAALVALLASSALGADSTAGRAPAGAGQARPALKKQKVYKGTFRGQRKSKAVLYGKRKGHRIKFVSRFEFVHLNASCPSGAPWISGPWTFGKFLKVKASRKFKLSGNDSDPETPSSLTIQGRFSKDFKKVSGAFKTSYHYEADPPLPEETCKTPLKHFSAKLK